MVPQDDTSVLWTERCCNTGTFFCGDDGPAICVVDSLFISLHFEVQEEKNTYH
jgi:hypothetical protein